MNKQGMRSIASAIALAMTTVAALAQTINIERYITRNAEGGVGLDANYDLGPDWDPRCCDPANVRWIQMITLLDGAGNVKNDVPGYPNGNFIDPTPNQPGGPWDNNPWYDVTYNNSQRNGATQGGIGRWMSDYPSGWGPFGPMSFNAETLVVCISEEAGTFCMLGGFSWGFNVGEDGTILRNGLAELADTAGRRAAFDAALQGTPAFSRWTMLECDPDCPELRLVVPEPASMTFLAFSIAAMALRRRKKSG